MEELVKQRGSMSFGAALLAAALMLALGTAPVSVAGEPVPDSAQEQWVSSTGETVESGPVAGGAGKAFAGSGAETVGTTAAPVIPDGTTEPGDQSPERSVIGADGRTQVSATTDFPSSAIGQITFRQGFSNFICSGWLIDMNTVLTAGHCVHEGDGGNFSTSVLFYPGRNGAVAPFGVCGAGDLLTTSAWADSSDPDFDLGIIQLDCNVGLQTGWLGFRSLSDAQLLGRNITVRGYPGDKPSGTMWTMDDAVQRHSAESVFYFADTAGGQSGAPVYETSGCNGPCGLAIHAYGASGSPLANSGPRITAEREGVFASVAADNNPPITTISSGPTGRTSNSSPSFGFEADKPGSTFECRIDGASFEPCSSPQAYSDLLDGEHVFEVKATDTVPLTGEVVSRSFTLDAASCTAAKAGQTQAKSAFKKAKKKARAATKKQKKAKKVFFKAKKAGTAHQVKKAKKALKMANVKVKKSKKKVKKTKAKVKKSAAAVAVACV